MEKWRDLLNRYNDIKDAYNGDELTDEDENLNANGEKIKEEVRKLFVGIVGNEKVAEKYLKMIGYDKPSNGLSNSADMLILMEKVVIFAAMLEGESEETVYGIAALNFTEGFEEKEYALDLLATCAGLAKLAKKDYSSKREIEEKLSGRINRFVEQVEPKTKQ